MCDGSEEGGRIASVQPVRKWLPFGSMLAMRAARPLEGAELYFGAAVISGEGRPGVGGRRQQGCLGVGAGEE
jgi:hypothetical protein